MGAQMEYRQDAGGSIVAKIDSNGFLRVDGIAAKAGVLTYIKPDGSIVRELVPVETLFDADALATLAGAPVTVGHPAIGLLTADNAKTYSKGAVAGTREDGARLAVGVTVTDSDAIKAVSRGTRQLSPGYTAMMDYTPGVTPDGQHYDAIQVSRTYNHLAIVDSARGGPECKINLDGFSCAVEVNHPTEVTHMPSVKLPNGATVEVADASTATVIQSEFNALQSRADAADEKTSEMVEKSKFDELQGKYDALFEEMKKKGEEKGDADQIGAYVELIESARKLKPDVECKSDGKYLEPVAIMAAAMGIDVAGRSVEYVQGRFDSALELQAGQAIAGQRETKTDSAPKISAVEQHRQNFLGGKA